ncbi:MAG TPA: protein kinase [Bacteroidota bacterium]
MDTKLIGRTIDSYQILDVLGKGGMGIVYRAKDLMLEKDVAVKMMDAPLDPQGRLLKRFQEEARSLARLQHPNIVGIYALRESQLGLCIVMELVRGKTLTDIIKENGALPPERVKKIFLQCLNALDHAHREGIIHRDIKPGNIMLTDDDVVKITDFGLAKRMDPSLAGSTVLVGGTLYYSPPEQLDSLADVDERGDIYSLGMTMYEALTGKVPFAETTSDFRIRQAIVEGDIPSPASMRSGIPRDLVQIVMKAISRDPKKRYQTAAEMLEALAAAGTGGAPAKGGARRRSVPVMAIAIVVLVLAAGAALYFLVPFHSGSRNVSGTLTIVVRERSGSPVANASVLVGPAAEASGGKVELSDLRTDKTSSGGLATVTNYMGEANLKYAGDPSAHLQVEVDADSYTHGNEAFMLPRDSVVVFLSKLTPSAGVVASQGSSTGTSDAAAASITVTVHDGSGNPVPTATVALTGNSGKEFTARTDGQGKATVYNYPLTAEGNAPSVRVAVERLKQSMQRSKMQRRQISPDMTLSLDVNDFVPYDQTLKEMQRGVEAQYSELRRVKDRIVASEAEKRSDANYQRGQEHQTLGERQLADRDFEDALASFIQAKDLYAKAAENLTARKTAQSQKEAEEQAERERERERQILAENAKKEAQKPIEVTEPPVKPPPKSTEPVKPSIAPPNVRAILQQYRNSFEHSDLAGLSRLLKFSKHEESTWSTFFDIAENVQVTTGGESVETKNDNAQLRFDVSISYQDKNDGEQKKIEGAVDMGLHYANGQWETTSHQFRQ